MSASTDLNDENSTGIRRLRWFVVIVSAAFLGLLFLLFLPSLISTRVPREQMFGAFDGVRASLSVTVVDEPPYQILIALPIGVTVPTDWSGSVSLTAPDGSQWSSACSAATMQPCNWLDDYPDLDCHILTWKSTPHLSEFMNSRQTYKLTITGNRPFPAPAILLLSGIKDSRKSTAKTTANKTATDELPGSLLPAMTHGNSNPRLAFQALPRPEAASA